MELELPVTRIQSDVSMQRGNGSVLSSSAGGRRESSLLNDLKRLANQYLSFLTACQYAELTRPAGCRHQGLFELRRARRGAQRERGAARRQAPHAEALAFAFPFSLLSLKFSPSSSRS
jgi:hypothetical protein